MAGDMESGPQRKSLIWRVTKWNDLKIFARIDEVRWLLSITTNPEDRERLEARIAELEKLLK